MDINSSSMTINGDLNVTGTSYLGDIVLSAENITADNFFGNLIGTWNNSGLYVPYTGATSNVDLGANNFKINNSVFFVNSTNGRVGIGTAAPDANLHILEDSPADIIVMERPTGVFAGKYSFSIAGGVFNFEDVTNSQFIFNVDYADVGGLGNLPILNIGQYSPANTQIGLPGLLKSASAGTTGTDKKGGDLLIASGGGRGDGTQSEIRFYTPDKVGSGTGEQTYSAKMVIKGDGNVGIGTTAPTAGKLQISNPDTTSNLIGIYLTNNDSDQYGLYIDGASQQGIALQGSADDSCYDGDGPAQCALNDYAEMMEFSELPEDGDLIIIDTENLGKLKVSTKPYDKLVVGIASEEPAMVIGSYGISIKGWDKNSTAKISPDGTEYYTYPLAISGRKLINVNNENGEVQPGDLLVTSSERGKAMRCEILELLGDDEIQDFEDLKENARRQKHNELCRNSAVAKAMTSAGEDGKVLALITLQ
ncbi:hypothetical protein KJ671_04235 [Patescibacteria group bacterium]|nr:hypothetical protein [Patescibacteria group bacterium]